MRAGHKGGQFKQSPCYIAQDRPELGLSCSTGQMGHMLSPQAVQHRAGASGVDLRGLSFWDHWRNSHKKLRGISLVKGVP